MATSSSHPTRSISLPARSHPTSLKIEETIQKLKSRDVCLSNSAFESIQLGLLNLVELYSRVQEITHSASNQQVNLVEDALESSVLLLDTCSNARDLIIGFREQVCDLQSALRRKAYANIETDVSVYASFRKKLAKNVGRCLKVLKEAEAKYEKNDAPLLDIEPSIMSLIREVYAITIVVFKSLFSFLSTPTKASKWSLISRFVTKTSTARLVVGHKQAASAGKEVGREGLNEVSKVDLALQNDTNVDVMLVRARIQALDSSLEIFEGEIGCLYRCLLQNRVSLLNILTPLV